MPESTKESKKGKRPLGRGLGSLLGSKESSIEFHESTDFRSSGKTENSQTNQTRQSSQESGKPDYSSEYSLDQSRVYQIPISKLVPGIYQPRKTFHKETLAELAASIKEKGILQPITVRKVGERFEIIAGERRWKAAQLAGLHDVPALLRSFDDQSTLEYAIIENVQRDDLDPIEEAEAYSRLAREFSLSQADIAQKVGKERSTVANALRLLGLPNAVREHLRLKEISVGHAKVLLGLTDSEKATLLAQKVALQKLSVRKLEEMVTQLTTQKDNLDSQSVDIQNLNSQNPTSPSDLTTQGSGKNLEQRVISDIQEEIQKKLATKVQIEYKNGKGKLSLHFYDQAQFDAIIETLRGHTLSNHREKK